MTVPENTTHRDPELHLLGTMSDGMGDYITGMESAGQRQALASEVIPTEIHGGSKEDLTALGFVLGDQVPGDPLFRHATLPPGWSKQSTEYALDSSIVDDLGRKRCGIFYKAAFYDRRASLSIESPSSYAWSIAANDALLILDDAWATREAMAAAFAEWEESETCNIARWRELAGTGNKAAAEVVTRHETQRATYARLRSGLELNTAAALSPQSGGTTRG